MQSIKLYIYMEVDHVQHENMRGYCYLFPRAVITVRENVALILSIAVAFSFATIPARSVTGVT